MHPVGCYNEYIYVYIGLYICSCFPVVPFLSVWLLGDYNRFYGATYMCSWLFRSHLMHQESALRRHRVNSRIFFKEYLCS